MASGCDGGDRGKHDEMSQTLPYARRTKTEFACISWSNVRLRSPSRRKLCDLE